MNLDKTTLEAIFKQNPTADLWREANEQRNTLQMHLLGLGMRAHIKRIEGYENEKTRRIREMYGKSNRDIFARILRPTDNIWSARGQSVQYMLPQTTERQLRGYLANIWNGYDVRRWVKTFWLPRFLDDPMGLIFMELDRNQASIAYPTYKASSGIFAAQIAGRRLEYVIFKTADPVVFRVVDDSFDRMVKWKGDKLVYLDGRKKNDAGDLVDYPVFPNYFGHVPAVVVSDLNKDGRADFFASPIDKEIELADMILREGSIQSLYRFKFGFSRPWTYPQLCPKCKGKKAINGATCSGEDGCNGTGVQLTPRPGDVQVFSWPDKDTPEIKDKGGYIQPDLDFLEYTDGWLQLIEKVMTRTHWGTYLQEDTNKPGEKETATARFIDVKPVEKRLADYAGSAESIEKFITDSLAEYWWQKTDIASVFLGRSFMLKDADDIWQAYQDARKNGAPITSLDDMLQDYYETKHQGNNQEKEKYLKLIKLEPGVHMTMGEAKLNLPYLEYMQKVCFLRFINSLTAQIIINSPLQVLQDQLLQYTTEYVAKVASTPDPLAQPAPVPGAGNNPKPSPTDPKPTDPKPAPVAA
jgi:hypothetical protein